MPRAAINSMRGCSSRLQGSKAELHSSSKSSSPISTSSNSSGDKGLSPLSKQVLGCMLSAKSSWPHQRWSFCVSRNRNSNRPHHSLRTSALASSDRRERVDLVPTTVRFTDNAARQGVAKGRSTHPKGAIEAAWSAPAGPYSASRFTSGRRKRPTPRRNAAKVAKGGSSQYPPGHEGAARQDPASVSNSADSGCSLNHANRLYPTHCCHSLATIRRLKAVVDQSNCLYLVPALGQPICAARRRLAFTTWQ